MKRALITGITGQDGSYLAELLLAKGYDAGGVVLHHHRGGRGLVEHQAGLVVGHADAERTAGRAGIARPGDVVLRHQVVADLAGAGEGQGDVVTAGGGERGQIHRGHHVGLIRGQGHSGERGAVDRDVQAAHGAVGADADSLEASVLALLRKSPLWPELGVVKRYGPPGARGPTIRLSKEASSPNNAILPPDWCRHFDGGSSDNISHGTVIKGN